MSSLVLFDTSVVARWHQDSPAFRLPLQLLFRELSKHGAMITRFVSVVTMQELMYWAITVGDPANLESFLTSNFSPPLLMDRQVALKAAQLQKDVGRPEKQRPRAVDDAAVDVWFRDATIVATAIKHKMDAIVTADGPMCKRFKPHFPGTIYLLEEKPLGIVPGKPSAMTDDPAQRDALRASLLGLLRERVRREVATKSAAKAAPELVSG